MINWYSGCRGGWHPHLSCSYACRIRGRVYFQQTTLAQYHPIISLNMGNTVEYRDRCMFLFKTDVLYLNQQLSSCKAGNELPRVSCFPKLSLTSPLLVLLSEQNGRISTLLSVNTAGFIKTTYIYRTVSSFIPNPVMNIVFTVSLRLFKIKQDKKSLFSQLHSLISLTCFVANVNRKSQIPN